MLYDHQEVECVKLENNVPVGAPVYESTIWGPSCDSMDMVRQGWCSELDGLSQGSLRVVLG